MWLKANLDFHVFSFVHIQQKQKIRPSVLGAFIPCDILFKTFIMF